MLHSAKSFKRRKPFWTLFIRRQSQLFRDTVGHSADDLACEWQSRHKKTCTLRTIRRMHTRTSHIRLTNERDTNPAFVRAAPSWT